MVWGGDIAVIVNPTSICINASSICQLRCPECTSAVYVRRINERGIDRYLKATDFDSLLGDNPWLKTVNLVNYGELFLNPDLIKILKCAFERNVELLIDAVNLNNVSDKALEALVRYKVRSVLVSIDGASDLTYKKYRVGGNLDSVLENIRKISSYKKKYGSPFPFLTWKFIIFGFNEHEISMARELAYELDMQFMPDLGSCGAGSDLYPEDREQLNYRALDSVFSPVRDKELVRQVLGYASIEEFQQMHGVHNRQGTCSFLFVMPFVHHDGSILGCCYTDPDHAFGGNVFKEGLLNCINSEKMQYAREMLKGRVPAKPGIPCSNCWVYEDMRAGGSWLNTEQQWDWEESYVMKKVEELAYFRKQYWDLEKYMRRVESEYQTKVNEILAIEERQRIFEADLAAKDDALRHTLAHVTQLEEALASRPTTRLRKHIKRLFGKLTS